MNAKTILSRFTLSFSSHGERGGIHVARWGGASSRTANMLALTGPTGRVLLYVRVRTEGSGFWGLNYAQLKSLQSSNLPWFVALLLGPSETAYLLPAQLVNRAIESGSWSEGKWEYKVHDNHEINGALRFNSYADLFDELVAAYVVT